MLFGFERTFLTRNWKFEGSGGARGEIGLLLYSPPPLENLKISAG